MTANSCSRLRAACLATVLLTMPALPLAAQAPATAAPATAAAPAESSSDVVPVDDLRAPTSPAFSLLGVTPASVDRPQNAKALTLNLLSAVTSADGIPKNYALELTPYWFKSHPGLTFDHYYSQRPALSVLRTFAVSVATAPLTADTSTAGSQVALGMRAMIVPGRANALLAELRRQLLALDGQLINGMGQGLAGLKHERDRYAAKLESASDSAERARWERRIREVDAKIAELAHRAAAASPDPTAAAASLAKAREDAMDLTARIRELDAQRVGFMLSVAEGQVWGFTDDSFSARQLTRTAVWLTPAYRVRPCDLSSSGDSLDCASSVDLIVVLRYLSDRIATSDPSRWDVGGRLAWQVNKPLALSVEAIRRNRPLLSTSSDPTHRAVAMVEYRVRDDMLFFASFGKDFEKGGDHKTLVTLMGVNFGLGQKPVIDLSESAARRPD